MFNIRNKLFVSDMLAKTLKSRYEKIALDLF